VRAGEYRPLELSQLPMPRLPEHLILVGSGRSGALIDNLLRVRCCHGFVLVMFLYVEEISWFVDVGDAMQQRLIESRPYAHDQHK